ncbi:MAG: AMP-binding protein, partial [Verrucomicrobiota bacterium]
LSILDLFLCLKHQATLILVPQTIRANPMKLAGFIAEQQATIWYSTPTTLRLLVEHGKLERHDFSPLRLGLFAGEVLPPRYVRAIQSAWPAARLFNLYGPTETNVCALFEIPAGLPETMDELPIGRPCFGYEGRVDGPDEPSSGELHVRGPGLMAGYWNGPPAEPWYATGDWVRAAEDGTLHFCGRRDRMVKRYGHRVEPAEVEACLIEHPEVTGVAVITEPSPDQGSWLIACLETPEPLSILDLKQYCAERLSPHLVPDRFVFYPSLPLTSTGKVDLQSLQESA